MDMETIDCAGDCKCRMARASGLCETCSMPKTIKKSDLPAKTCAHCGKPFAWRKKWAKVWAEVKYCSDRCRAAARGGARA
jgi:hypothetical protein